MKRIVELHIWMEELKDFDDFVKSIQEYLMKNRAWERYWIKVEPLPYDRE